MALVIDTSVLVSWVVPSQASDYAKRVARRARIEDTIVPALWEAEFANVMTTLLRRRLLSRHEVMTILGKTERLDLVIDRHAVSPRTLFELTERYGISAYDACYIELAERRGIPLATRDANLERAARAARIALA